MHFFKSLNLFDLPSRSRASCLSAAICLLLFSGAAVKAEGLKDYYEQIHAHPELGKQEFKTAEYVRSKLREFGYTRFLSLESLPTTVLSVLDSGRPGPVICFRCEMDARKCQEQTGLPFASKSPGLMHNCGHDAHTAILLETARRLAGEQNELNGQIVFLFQPAEECAGGADDIVRDGILKRLGVQAMFAQHCAPGMPAGKHSLHPGPVLAGSSSISVKLTGTGGHAAQPHERDDLPALASLITLEMERLPSRRLDVIAYPTVIALTTSRSSSEQTNVAPDSITLGGTIRAFFGVEEKLFGGKSLHELIDQLVNGLAGAYGLTAGVSITPGSPVTVNDPELCSKAKALLESTGIKIDDAEKGMFSEDFSYYTASIPCAYFGLGVARAEYGKDNLHSGRFTIHEDCLESGVDLFVTLARGLARAAGKGSKAGS